MTQDAMMTWPQLLNWRRLGLKEHRAFDPKRSPWQFDYDRIVFSAAFRRLQDKTQVFPLSGGGDYVRTRLTHSLEVSTVARTLGMEAAEVIFERHGDEFVQSGTRGPKPLRAWLTHADIGSVVANAALAHDLGNPPFGHSGEDAVRYWFSTSTVLADVLEDLTDEQRCDLENWEGNAQGFRILTRHELYPDAGGFQLTYSTLGAFCKYPARAGQLVGRKKDRLLSRKKNGYFSSETAFFDRIAKETGMIRQSDGGTCRHPLAFLMEAADDICYRIIDLEDGVRFGRVPAVAAIAALREIVDPGEKRLSEIAHVGQKIAYLRARCIGELIRQTADAFARVEDSILRGEHECELVASVRAKPALDAITALVKEHVYPAADVLQVEAIGFEVIPGLLDIFLHAVLDAGRDRHDLRADKIGKVMRACWPEFPEPKGMAPFEKILAVIDLVAGMTDSFALSMYRRFKGISLPS